jgi:excisionase family DNA binding protein
VLVSRSRLDELFDGYPEQLSVPQLADVLGIKRTTAYRWLQAGIVPAYKVGGAWVILRDEVRDMLASSRWEPKDGPPPPPSGGS